MFGKEINLLMNKRVTQIILGAACACMLIAIGFVIGINVNFKKKHKAKMPEISRSWVINQDDLAVAIDDNFWKFARASYFLVGTPPDCQFYKIVDEVSRHNYDMENFFAESNGLYYYHDSEGNKKSTVAIDVSGYQTSVDWEKVKAAGVEVAMIRVGYRGYGSGAIVEDDMFKDHIEKAIEAGLEVGVYFYSQAISYDEGVEEARFVLDLIRDYRITCPVAFDTEFLAVEDSRAYNLDNDARTDAVVGFCETVKAAGYEPMIYSNRNWYAQNLDMTRLGDYSLWLAHYSNQPDFPYHFEGWQYTGDGSLYGVDGAVDLNVWLR